MSKHSASQCTNGIELADYALTHGAEEVRQAGSHKIIRLPNGENEVIPQHRWQLGKGLRYKILKHLAAAGITVLLVAIVLTGMIV